MPCEAIMPFETLYMFDTSTHVSFMPSETFLPLKYEIGLHGRWLGWQNLELGLGGALKVLLGQYSTCSGHTITRLCRMVPNLSRPHSQQWQGIIL
jgi:hypothetical protein